MITCLGLIVGMVTSAVRQDVLNQCAEFMKKHAYLHGKVVEFEINKVVYATAFDSAMFDDGKFGVLFETYDGFTLGAEV